MSAPEHFFDVLDTVDSTNNYAMGQVHAGVWQHGKACFSLEQTAGKGTRGKQWLSTKRENIILSIVADTSFLPISNLFCLSAVTGLACFDLFSRYAPTDTAIKWPNDLFWNDRKAGGVLIENVIRGDNWQYAIIGIGINVNQTVFDLSMKRAVSLKQITGKNYEVLQLADELYTLFFERYEMLKSKAYPQIITEYNDRLFGKDKTVRIKKGSAVFETTIDHVSIDGTLHTRDVLDRSFQFGEIEWLTGS